MKRIWEYCVVVVTLKLHLQVLNNQVKVREFYKPTKKRLHSSLKLFFKTKNSEKFRKFLKTKKSGLKTNVPMRACQSYFCDLLHVFC